MRQLHPPAKLGTTAAALLPPCCARPASQHLLPQQQQCQGRHHHRLAVRRGVVTRPQQQGSIGPYYPFPQKQQLPGSNGAGSRSNAAGGLIAARRQNLLSGSERLALDEVWVPFRWPGQLGGQQVFLSGSWCDWKEGHTQLVQCSRGANNSPGDWVAMYKMKVGQHEYKFFVDGAWKVAPGDPLVMDPEGNINNSRLFVKNCHIEFSFRSGTPPARLQQASVSVVGSWSNWKVATPMQKDGLNKWFTELSLPPGAEYHFRFLVDDPLLPAPHVAVSDQYDTDQVSNAEGSRVTCNKVVVGMPPAFYLYYATGWRNCTIMYKLLRDGQAVHPGWQALAMDDSPSRAEPSGEGSRWKQVIVALPAGVAELAPGEVDRYSLEFFLQGPPASGDGSDSDERPTARAARRGSGSQNGSGGGRQGGGSQDGGGSGDSLSSMDVGGSRWYVPLADGQHPEELKKVVKVDSPSRKASAAGTYLLRWPGGWKLQGGTVTKFPTVNRPPVLLCSDIDGTMVNEHPDVKEQFWMDSRTREFQEYWESSAALARSVLVYNTGRSKGQLINLLKQKPMLAVPDVLITAVGTKIWYLPDGMRAFQDPTEVEWIEDKAWAARLDDGWDLKTALSCAGEMLSVFNRDGPDRVKWLDKGQEHPHRVALQVHVAVLDDVISRLTALIDKTQLQARIITSGAGDWRYVDVVHRLAGKLEALEWVRALYNVPVQRCVTAGDSCNDILMLDGSCPAIIVGNAQAELVAWFHEQNDRGRIVLTDKPEAVGVLEGLARHGLYG